MSQWQKVPLNKVAEIERDSINPSAITNGTTYVGLENIETGGLFVNVRKVTKGELASSKFAFTDKHILYGKLRPYLAKIARPTFSGICSTDILPILPSSKVNRDYLTHFLCQSSMIELATSRSTGANLPRLSPKILAEFLIPLPPIDQQKRIAAILDKAEELRRLRRQSIEHLDVLSRSIFIEMFGDVGATSKFSVQPLEKVLIRSLQNGAYFQKESYVESDGIEMVHMSDAFYKVVIRGNLKQVNCSEDEYEKYSLSSTDILIARRSLTYEGAAKPCLIPYSSIPLIFESSFIRVSPDSSKVITLFLFHYLNNDWVRQKCVRPFITKSTISGINQSNLARIPILIPPLPLQQEFAQRIEAIESLKSQHRESLAHLDTLFASLQHRAFRGEL